jgi:hypothetical protein
MLGKWVLFCGRGFGPGLAMLLLLIFGGLARAAAEENLLLNPELNDGGSMPDHWHPSRRIGCDSFQWLHAKGSPAELRIGDTSGSDAAWAQGITVSPGWYHLSAELRTEEANPFSGAYLAVKQGQGSASALWRGNDWQRDGFYVHVWRADPLVVQCGLSAINLRTVAFCRDFSLTKISSAPPAGARVFELEKPAPPSGINSTSAALVLLLGVLGFIYNWFADSAAPWDTADNPSEKEAARLHGTYRYLEGFVIEARHHPWRSAGMVASFGLLLVGILAVTRLELVPGAGLSIVTPEAMQSDEPHYLLYINSLLFDHDFELQDDYERVAMGGVDAGARFPGHHLDHHTLIVNRQTGHYAFASVDSPNSVVPCDPEFTASNDVYEVSAHPAGLPILMALLLTPFHPALADVEGEAATILALISWLGALVTYLAGRSSGMGRARAMLASVILVGASSWLAYSRSFFPESTVGLALILALWAMISGRPILAGLATGVAAFLKPQFAVVGFGFIINEIRAGRWRNAVKLGAILAVCGLPIMMLNYWLAGTPLISGNASWLRASSFQSLYETFLEPAHGLLYFVPWVVIAFIAIVRAFRSDAPDASLLRQMAIPLVLYLVLVSCSGTGPGLCYGPRYWISFLPWFALAVMQSANRARRPALVVCGLLVVLGALVAIPGALRYPQVFSREPWVAWQRK